ncbi:MAG: hypothetical protein LIO46_05975 [Clostridiales bacterium]|nr:hypothetical protein [Clostridiales bacterium]
MGFVPGWQLVLAAYGAGLPFSLSHAAATVVFLLPIYKPWCRKIRRIQRKYGIALPDQEQT